MSSNAAAVSSTPVISVHDLRKRFAGVAAVDGISFEVERGEVLGFLGPNGAGKTTTMRILAGFFPPSEGRVRIAGHDVVTESMAVRALVGYMPESVPLYHDMRVEEYLDFRSRIKGVALRDRQTRIGVVLERCLLAEVRKRIIGQLSKGFRQRVGLADALISDPPILVLDEPTIGLDPNQIRQARTVMKELGRDHTVILSTHILPEVEMVCRRVMIIDKGKIVATDSVENLRAARGHASVRVEIRGDRAQVKSALAGVPGVESIEELGGADGVQRLLLRQGAGQDVREGVAAEVAKHGWGLRELALQAITLDEIFGRITTGAGIEGEAGATPAAGGNAMSAGVSAGVGPTPGGGFEPGSSTGRQP